jgi:DNA-binding transcriptional LysR family regulator
LPCRIRRKWVIVPFAQTPLYAVLPETHPAADKEHVMLQDLARDEVLAQRRLGYVQSGRSLSKAQFLGQDDDRMQVTDFNVQEPSPKALARVWRN